MLPILALLTAHATALELWTVSPGGNTATSWGHTLLHVDDGRRDVVYNYGRFQRTPTFVEDFLTNDLAYWLDVEDARSALRRYESTGRGVAGWRIEVPDDRFARLVAALREESEPDNRTFAYDPISRNCTTRTRDALDTLVFDGALRAATEARPHGTSYRVLSSALLADEPWVAWGAHALWGPLIHRELTTWEAFALPVQLHDGLGAIASGELEVTLPEGVRIEPLGAVGELAFSRGPAPVSPMPLLGGLLGLWALLFGAPAARPDSRVSTAAILTGSTLWGLLGAAAGVVLFAMAWRDTPATHWNVNRLGMHPLLVLLPLLTAARVWGRGHRVLVALAAVPWLAMAIGPLIGQTAWPYLLPAALAQTALAVWSHRRADPGAP